MIDSHSGTLPSRTLKQCEHIFTRFIFVIKVKWDQTGTSVIAWIINRDQHQEITRITILGQNIFPRKTTVNKYTDVKCWTIKKIIFNVKVKYIRPTFAKRQPYSVGICPVGKVTMKVEYDCLSLSIIMAMVSACWHRHRDSYCCLGISQLPRYRLLQAIFKRTLTKYQTCIRQWQAQEFGHLLWTPTTPWAGGPWVKLTATSPNLYFPNLYFSNLWLIF